MSDAIEFVYYIYKSMLEFLFNDAVIVPGVSIGWIMISIIVFGILVSAFVVVPKGAFDTSVKAVRGSDKNG